MWPVMYVGLGIKIDDGCTYHPITKAMKADWSVTAAQSSKDEIPGFLIPKVRWRKEPQI